MSDSVTGGYYISEMHPKSDSELLREYVEDNREGAFAEIVNRHTNLVYSAALRQVNSLDIAAEVSQSVFVGLARGAGALCARLSADATLAGWLCRSARNVSLNLRRNEMRRHSHERLAMEQLDPAPETSHDWERLRPVLDEAMSELSEPDYDAVVLRFFNNQDLLSVGRALGVSDDAAQKRVSRALDKLRDLLCRRGITTTAAALSVVLSGNAVQMAPAGLATAISSAAALSGTAIAATATATASKAIVMTTLQKAFITVTIIAGVGTPLLIQHRSQAKLLEKNQSLQQQADQLAQLTAENERLSKVVAQSASPKPSLALASSDLLRLRGLVGVLRQQNEELAHRLVERQPPTADYEPSTSWADAGIATPEAAAHTFAWAVKAGNKDRLAEILMPGTDEPTTNLTELAGIISEGLQPVMSDVEASRFVLKDNPAPDEATFWFQNRFKDGHTYVWPITLKRSGAEWKVQMGIVTDNSSEVGQTK